MEFDTYIKKTRETAVYPEDYERDYVIHGLVDELGELSQAIQEGPEIGSKYTRAHVFQICKEMGDVMWYLARLCDHFNFDLRTDNIKVAKKAMDTEYGEEKIQEALFAATEINGHQKKSVRDDANRRNHIKGCAQQIINCLEEASHHLGVFNLELVMKKNIDKLFDRKDRDVLHGDGDNR